MDGMHQAGCVPNKEERRRRRIPVLKSKKGKKPTALLFVDYEHWYISMTKLHKKKPNLMAWRESILERYDIKDLYVFADYSHPNLQVEIPRIREVTNMVIETKNNTSRYEKDYTDFIILDHIYQHAVSDKDVDCFIIFTGDGHFSSVVNFIRQKCGKEVGVFAVRFAASSILKSAASWFVELPEEERKPDPDMPYMDLVLAYLKDREKKKEYPAMTLPEICRYVAKYAEVEEDKLKQAANKLITLGYAKRAEKITPDSRLVSIIEPDWDKMKKDDFWDDELFDESEETKK